MVNPFLIKFASSFPAAAAIVIVIALADAVIAVEFIELFKVSAVTSSVIPEARASVVSEYPPIFDILFAI